MESAWRERPCCWAWSATKDLSSGTASGLRSSTSWICVTESEPCELKLIPFALDWLELSELELELYGFELYGLLEPKGLAVELKGLVDELDVLSLEDMEELDDE